MKPPLQLELAALKRDWIDDVSPRIAAMLPALGTFTADDLRGKIPEPPQPNWIGCLMARLRNTGLIQEAGRVRSTRRNRNGAKISAWRAAL
jgi:hypothetical protein